MTRILMAWLLAFAMLAPPVAARDGKVTGMIVEFDRDYGMIVLDDGYVYLLKTVSGAGFAAGMTVTIVYTEETADRVVRTIAKDDM